ncbi:MAG: ABC transporter permease [Anaerolineales bacterium]|nr:ABC transporter permease [Anaerolineales bacterium]
MLKTFLIGLKDLKIAFRDRAAIVFMLLTPFLLTIGMGLVTGRFSSNDSSGALNIPIVIVNLDNDSLGDALVEVFNSEELADLVEPTISQDAEAARTLVDEDETTVAIIIPSGFTQSIFSENINQSENIQIEFYANPSRPTSAGIVKTILDGFMARVDEMRVGSITSVAQLIISGRISPEQANAVGEEMGARFENTSTDFNETLITLNTSTNETETNEVDMLAFLAPGMALMFLMYTVSYGGRSILAEKAGGTLPRLLVTPTNSMQILGGKVFGIFLTGAAQMLILIGATTLFFQLQWGDVIGVVLLVFAAVFGATGWGLFITALARTPAQVGSVGTAVMLIFGILGGSFFEVENLPVIAQMFSKITPNAWALDGFTSLAFGGNLASLTTPLLALLTMGIVLFLISALLFGRKNLVQK